MLSANQQLQPAHPSVTVQILTRHISTRALSLDSFIWTGCCTVQSALLPCPPPQKKANPYIFPGTFLTLLELRPLYVRRHMDKGEKAPVRGRGGKKKNRNQRRTSGAERNPPRRAHSPPWPGPGPALPRTPGHPPTTQIASSSVATARPSSPGSSRPSPLPCPSPRLLVTLPHPTKPSAALRRRLQDVERPCTRMPPSAAPRPPSLDAMPSPGSHLRPRVDPLLRRGRGRQGRKHRGAPGFPRLQRHLRRFLGRLQDRLDRELRRPHARRLRIPAGGTASAEMSAAAPTHPGEACVKSRHIDRGV